MTNIYYGKTNDLRKGCSVFASNENELMDALCKHGSHIIVAEDQNDEFLKSLVAEYGYDVVPASAVPNGTSAEIDSAIQDLQAYGIDDESIVKELGCTFSDIIHSDSFLGESRIEKTLRERKLVQNLLL